MKILNRPVLAFFSHCLISCLVSQTIFVNSLHANESLLPIENPVSLEDLVSGINETSFNRRSNSNAFLSQVNDVQKGMVSLLLSVDLAKKRLKIASVALEQATPENRSLLVQALATATSDFRQLDQLSTAAEELSKLIYTTSGLLSGSTKTEFDYRTFFPRSFSDDEISSKNAATAAKKRWEKAKDLAKRLNNDRSQRTELAEQLHQNEISRAVTEREAAYKDYLAKNELAKELRRRSVDAERIYNKALELRTRFESGQVDSKQFFRTILRDKLSHRISIGFGLAPVPPFDAVLYLAKSESKDRFADRLGKLRFIQRDLNREFKDLQNAEDSLRRATSETDRLDANKSVDSFTKRLKFQRSKRAIIREELKFFSADSGVSKNENGTYSVAPTTTIGDLGYTVGSAWSFVTREYSKMGEPTTPEAKIASGIATLAYSAIELLVLDRISLYEELANSLEPAIVNARAQKAELTAARIEQIVNIGSRLDFALAQLAKIPAIE